MKNNIFLMTILVLSSCSSVNKVPTTPGNDANSYVIHCHDLDGTRDECLREANELCKEGFLISEKHSYKYEHGDSGDGVYMPPEYSVTVICDKS